MKTLIGRKYNRRCHKVVHSEIVRRVTEGKKWMNRFLAAASSTCLRYSPFRRAVEDTEIVSTDGSGTFVQEVNNGYHIYRYDDKDPLYVICNF